MSLVARIIFLIASINISFIGLSQEPFVLYGRVTQFNTNKKPLYPVQIKSDYSNPTVNESNGNFKLILENVNVGEKIKLRVIYNNWIVVNEKELDQVIAGNLDTINIYLSTKEQIDLSRLTYYNISQQNLTARYRKELSALHKDRKEDAEKIKLLTDQYNATIQSLQELSDKFSRIDLYDISEVERQALTEFLAGNIDESLKKLKSVDSKSILTKTSRDIDRWKENKAEADSNLIRGKLIVSQQIRKLLLEANIHLVNLQVDSAKICYETIYLSDSTNLDYLYYYTIFLNEHNKTIDARPLYQKGLTLSKTRADSAYAYDKMANYYRSISDYAKAAQFFLLSIAIIDSTTQNKASRREINIFHSWIGLGQLQLSQGDVSEALEYYDLAEKYLKWTKKTDDQYFANRALVTGNKGRCLLELKKLSQAKDYLMESLMLYDTLAKLDPLYATDVAISYSALSEYWLEKKEIKLAEELEFRALAIMDSLDKINPIRHKFQLGARYIRLGEIFEFKKDTLKATEFYQTHLEIFEKLANASPNVYTNDLAQSYKEIGSYYWHHQNLTKAKLYTQKSFELYTELYNEFPDHYDKALNKILNGMGNLCLQRKEFSEAEEYLKGSLIIADDLYQKDPYEFCITIGYSNAFLASLYEEINENEKALDHIRKAKHFFLIKKQKPNASLLMLAINAEKYEREILKKMKRK